MGISMTCSPWSANMETTRTIACRAAPSDISKISSSCGARRHGPPTWRGQTRGARRASVDAPCVIHGRENVVVSSNVSGNAVNSTRPAACAVRTCVTRRMTSADTACSNTLPYLTSPAMRSPRNAGRDTSNMSTTTPWSDARTP